MHIYIHEISGGAKRSLDSTVSSLLALIGRDYAQPDQHRTGLYTLISNSAICNVHVRTLYVLYLATVELVLMAM